MYKHSRICSIKKRGRMHELIAYVREVCQKKQASKLHVCIMYVYIGMQQANRSMYTYMQVAAVSFFSHQEGVRAPVQAGRPAVETTRSSTSSSSMQQLLKFKKKCNCSFAHNARSVHGSSNALRYVTKRSRVCGDQSHIWRAASAAQADEKGH